MTIDLHSHRCS